MKNRILILIIVIFLSNLSLIGCNQNKEIKNQKGIFSNFIDENILFFVFVGLFASFVPGDIVGDMTSIGTLFAFILVCAGVWIMRNTHPEIQRQFKTPWVPFVPILGIVACGAMIFGLGWANWTRLGAWLIIGLIFYFSYGIKKSTLNDKK